jgi:hypothetical protein
MKYVSLLVLTTMFLVSCSMFKPGRNIASKGNQCELIKHDSKNLYQVTMNGTPYNKYWYDQDYASQLHNSFKKTGKCI